MSDSVQEATESRRSGAAQSPTPVRRSLLRSPATVVVAAAVAYLVAVWLAIALVDVFNVFGSATRLAELAGERNNPGLWVQVFTGGGPTEVLAWSALAATALLSGLLSGLLRAHRRRAVAGFWLLFGVAMLLMLIEDAGDTRHTLADYVELVTGGSRTARIATELAFFSALASVPLYALARYWRDLAAVARSRRFLVAGFAFYGVAATASGTRNIADWYHRVGTYIDQVVLQGRMLLAHNLPESHGFHIMDYILEETVELLGAVMLLAAALAFLEHVRRTQPSTVDPASAAARAELS